jgi:hypothetical protein
MNVEVQVQTTEDPLSALLALRPVLKTQLATIVLGILEPLCRGEDVQVPIGPSIGCVLANLSELRLLAHLVSAAQPKPRKQPEPEPRAPSVGQYL